MYKRQLKHLVQLTEYVTGLDARIGYPTEHLTAGQNDDIKNPMYATGIGLILQGFADSTESQQPEHETAGAAEEQQRKGGWFKSIVTSTKRWFEDDEAEDFR